MSNSVRYTYGSYNFTTADGQNYNLMDLAVGTQKLPLLDRARVLMKTRIRGCNKRKSAPMSSTMP